MTTIRIEKSNNFSVISNHHLRNTNLSLKAKGLLTYLLSLPDNWNANVKHLVKTCTDGKTAIYSAIKELKEARYIEQMTIRDDKAKIIRYEYVVHENPVETLRTPVNREEKLHSENLKTAFLKTEKLNSIIKTNNSLKTDFNKNDDTPEPDPPPEQKPVRSSSSPLLKENKKTLSTPYPNKQESIPAFVEHDLLNLMKAIPQDKQSKNIEQRLHNALLEGVSAESLYDCIAYTLKHSKTDFYSYLDKCINKQYAPEGYSKENNKSASQEVEMESMRKYSTRNLEILKMAGNRIAEKILQERS